MSIVRTVLGEIAADSLGRTLAHEHVIAGWLGCDWDPACPPREERIREAVRQLVQARERSGVTAIVDPTPPDLGRDLPAVREVSERSGTHIIAATGLYHLNAGYPQYWRLASEDDLYAMFLDDLEIGSRTDGVTCGVVKVATIGVELDELEHKLFRAASRAAIASGAPVMTHTEHEAWQTGNPGLAQVAALAGAGLRPERVLVGHACGSSRVEDIEAVAATGASIGFDRIGAEFYQPDPVRAATVAALIRGGYREKIFLSHDHQAVWLAPPTSKTRTAGSLLYLAEVFWPMLQSQGVVEEDIDAIMSENPRCFFQLGGPDAARDV